MHSRLPPGFEDLPVDEALRASEERFRRLAETASDGILTIDEESTILFSNQAVERIFGYSAEELSGQKLTLLMAPPLQARHTAALERYLATGEKSLRWEGTEFPARHKSGAELAVEVAFGAFTAGGRRFFTGFVRDIGERRRAAEELERQRALLDSLIDAAPLAVITMDPGGKVERWNRAAQRIFGWSASEVVGRPYPLVPPGKEDEYDTIVADSLRGRQRVGFETQRRRRDGSLVDVAISTAAVRGADGRIATLVGLCEDISERKQAEEARRRSEEELRALNERLRALSARLLQIREDERAAMSREIHDQLGQALIGLRFHVAALRQTPPETSEALRAKLGEVMAIADSTMVMVRNLAADLRPVVLDSLGLAAAVEWQAREVARRSGLKVEVDLHIGPLWPRRELSTAVYRCLQEALINVERHAAATEVKVWLAADHQLLVLEIHDDGRGIRPEEIQGPASLGLLGMRERAAAFGGEVMLHGEAGRGTVVRVEVPLTPGDHGGESA